MVRSFSRVVCRIVCCAVIVLKASRDRRFDGKLEVGYLDIVDNTVMNIVVRDSHKLFDGGSMVEWDLRRGSDRVDLRWDRDGQQDGRWPRVSPYGNSWHDDVRDRSLCSSHENT